MYIEDPTIAVEAASEVEPIVESENSYSDDGDVEDKTILHLQPATKKR